MMAGYGFGAIMLREPAKRKRCCLWIGLTGIAAFLVVGTLFVIYGQTGGYPNGAPPFYMQLLNQKKYPPSQLFLLMTLGPLIACVPLADRAKGWFAGVLKLFGRVPMFYYLLHILLIHVSALTVNLIREGNAHQDWYNTAPFTEIDEANRWGLPLLYLVYVIDLVILYFACRRYADYKFRHPEKKWLKYL
jgi:uncharacterized membrane protein